MKTLITNATIVIMQNEDVIYDGCIAVEGNRIIYVGDKSTLNSEFRPDNIINAQNKLVMPGLINAHTHSGMALLRNYADDLLLEDWLYNKIFPAEDKFTGDDIYWSAMLCIAEMIKTGTTCFGDMYFFVEQVAQAVEQTGIRANLSRGMVCPESNFDIHSNTHIKEQRDLYDNWHNKANGRIKVNVGPHSVYTTSPEYLRACVDLAKQLDTGIHIHILETDTERQESIQKFGVTSVEHCNNVGLFDMPTMAAHSIHLSDEDIDMYADKNVNVLHCPGSNLKLGSGIAPIGKFMDKGINVCLGTDSVASNNNLDMFEEIRLAATLHKGVNQDAQLVSAYQALQMATVNGAHALGFGMDVGAIKAGMKADLIIIDIDKINYCPNNNIISALAYSANSSDVDTVMVDGRILLEKGELKTIDEEEVKYNIKKLAQKL